MSLHDSRVNLRCRSGPNHSRQLIAGRQHIIPLAPRALVCPQDNNTLYLGPRNGNQFIIECSYDHYGGDETNGTILTTTFDGCVNLCDLQQACVAVSYVPNAQAGSPAPCYLKNILNKCGVIKQGVWSARRLDAPVVTLPDAPPAPLGNLQTPPAPDSPLGNGEPITPIVIVPETGHSPSSEFSPSPLGSPAQAIQPPGAAIQPIVGPGCLPPQGADVLGLPNHPHTSVVFEEVEATATVFEPSPCPSCQPNTITLWQPTTSVSFVTVTYTQPCMPTFPLQPPQNINLPLLGPPLRPPGSFLRPPLRPPLGLPPRPPIIHAAVTSTATIFAAPTLTQTVVGTVLSTISVGFETQTRTLNSLVYSTQTSTETIDDDPAHTIAAWAVTEFAAITTTPSPGWYSDCSNEWVDVSEHSCGCNREVRAGPPRAGYHIWRRDLMPKECVGSCTGVMHTTLRSSTTMTQYVTATGCPYGVQQLSDGQVQAPGQVAPAPAPIDQVSDEQVQVPENTPAQQLGDGQVQVSEESYSNEPDYESPVQQIDDGQVEIPPSSPPAPAPTSEAPPEESLEEEGEDEGYKEKGQEESDEEEGEEDGEEDIQQEETEEQGTQQQLGTPGESTESGKSASTGSPSANLLASTASTVFSTTVVPASSSLSQQSLASSSTTTTKTASIGKRCQCTVTVRIRCANHVNRWHCKAK